MIQVMLIVKKYKYLIISSLIAIIFVVSLGLIAINRWPTLWYFILPGAKPTQQEQEILTGIKADITPQESVNLTKKAAPLAKNAPYLEVGNCEMPRPPIVKAKVNSLFRFTNSSNESRILIFNERQISLNPRQSRLILLDFFHFVPAVYGYSCNYSPGPVGVMLIEE